MLYVFRTATAGQKALMEGLAKDGGNIRALNQPGLFGAESFGFSGKVLAAIKDAGIVVEKHGAWAPWLLLIFPAIFALGAFIGFGGVFVLWMAALVGVPYTWHRAAEKFGAWALFDHYFAHRSRDEFEWASDSHSSSDFHTYDPSDARSASYTSSYWDR